jgi:hypothetical protein
VSDESVKNGEETILSVGDMPNSAERLSAQSGNPESVVAESVGVIAGQVDHGLGQIHTALISLKEAYESSIQNQLGFALLVVVVGALSAYLLNLFHWRMVERRSKVARLARTLSTLIHELQSESVNYWAQEYRNENDHKMRCSEISIKSNLRLISRYVGLFVSELDKKDRDSYGGNLEDFKCDIFDLVTGDLFESKTRMRSSDKAMKIANKCSDARAIMSSF